MTSPPYPWRAVVVAPSKSFRASAAWIAFSRSVLVAFTWASYRNQPAADVGRRFLTKTSRVSVVRREDGPGVSVVRNLEMPVTSDKVWQALQEVGLAE